MSEYKTVSVIGCGRWGGFLGYYIAKYLDTNVIFYGREESKRYQDFKNKRKNQYLRLPENVDFSSNLGKILENELIVISIGCQNLRDLAKELNNYDLSGKTFILAMKGLEKSTSKRLTEVMKEEITQKNVNYAVLLGPGHVQDYVSEIPSCAVLDCEDNEFKIELANFFNSELIRVYYGSDLIGNEIGAALKNVIGIAAGILDGLNWHGLKGALMARAPVEVGRIIEYFGGDKRTAYGLSHLGDYEATLFSKHSHNRRFGEALAKGIRFEKLAEGVATLNAVYQLRNEIDIPICEVLYEVVYNKEDPKIMISKLFHRPTKKEFNS
jgi:glycerol-3-phosphate dehydrogenase (NAD(P)+)